MIYPAKDSSQSSTSDSTTLPTKDQSSMVPSKDMTPAGDTLPVMTGTDKTTVEPGIPTMQPSLSSTSADTLISNKDKTMTLTSSAPAKDRSSTSAPAKDQTSASVPTKDQISTSVPAKDQISSSVAAADQTPNSLPAKDSLTSSMPGKDQSSLSTPATDQTPYSIPGKDQMSTSVPPKDQSISSPASAMDVTSATSTQGYGFSIPMSSKDDKTSLQPETAMSNTELYGTDTALTSSTVPSVVIYSFTLSPSSVPSSSISSKPETSASVVISSFTVPSIIYSFTLPSSTLESSGSVQTSGLSPSEPEISGSPIKLGQSLGGKDSNSRVNGPYYNASSSLIPLWTPDMLGNAYGGGFIKTPSIYVTLPPSLTASASGVPPGYGFSLTQESFQSTDKPISSNDKTGSTGPQSQTIVFSGSSSLYATDQYGIPSSGPSSTTGAADCCGTSTTLSVGQIDNSGAPVSVPIGGASTSESSATSYIFGPVLPTHITTAPYGGNTSSPIRNESNGTGTLLNPTSLPDYSGFAIKNTMGFTAGILGILVFVFLI